MAKRLHDCELWGKPWFRHLNAEQKILWLYIWDHCDCGGIWEIDFETFEFRTGIKSNISSLDIFRDKIKNIGNTAVLVYGFIDSCWGKLLPTLRMYKPVNSALSKYNLSVEKLYEQQPKMPEVEL